jgi:outer membrane lipoprotein SlyB
MKLAPYTAALAAVVAAGSLATPSLAQDYRYGRDAGYGYVDSCTQFKHERTTSGGVIGALAGAFSGSSLAAHSGGRAGGAVLGALAGAAVGTNVGRDSAKNSAACSDGYYAPRASYYRSDYGYGYAPERYRSDDSYGRGEDWDR